MDRPAVETANKTSDHLEKTPQRKNPAIVDDTLLQEMNGQSFTPAAALKMGKGYITRHERREIWKYEDIYYIGQKAKKVYSQPHNRGFDSPSRTYRVALRDHIQYRYEVVRVLGSGFSSIVYEAMDHKTRTIVALKCFRHDKRCAHLAEQEERILRHLSSADVATGSSLSANIVQLLDAFTFRRHRFIVLEILSDSLLNHLESRGFAGMTVPQIRAVSRSILRSLVLLDKEGIIHGDLKPENIILRSRGKTGIKVIDFGTSCFEGHTLHTYYQTRYYRAPEVVLGLKYGKAIDMWSFGCILAELLTGVPLFQASDEVDLMKKMVEMLGSPPAEMREKHRDTQQGQPSGFIDYFAQNGTTQGDKVTINRNIRSSLGESATDFLVDFLGDCLHWDPIRRMTPLQAVAHPFMRES